MADQVEPNSSQDQAPPAKVDRRECYRAQLTDSSVGIRCWKIAPGTPLKHSPKPSQEVQLTVTNIGTGGMAIVLTDLEAASALTSTDRLRIELTHGETSVLMEGKLRSPNAIQRKDTIRTGIRFDGRASNFGYHKACSTLATIVGFVQRNQLKARHAAEETEPKDPDGLAA